MLTYLRMAPYLAILLLLAWGARVNDLRDRWHHQYEAEHTGRLADRASYTAAQAQAQADNQAKVAQVKAQQEAISEKARSDYSRDLERLRAQSRTAQGAAGSAGASGVPKAASGTDADGLPNAPCDNLCASEIELRLMYLQNWIAGQVGIDPNAP